MIFSANLSRLIEVLFDIRSASAFNRRIDLTLSSVSPQHKAHLTHLKRICRGYSKLKLISPDYLTKHTKRLSFTFPMPCRKPNILFLFLLHLLSPFQLFMLFSTCSLLFLASSSHISTPILGHNHMILTKKYCCPGAQLNQNIIN